jgi:hypothetical protein
LKGFSDKLDQFRNALTLGTLLALRSGVGKHHTELLEQVKSLHAAIEQQRLSGKVVELDYTQTGFQASLKNISSTNQKIALLKEEVTKCVSALENILDWNAKSKGENILRWLDFRQKMDRYDEIPIAHRKTFEWAFDRSFDECPWDSLITYFEEDGLSMPYWINGKAGSGKSSFMKFVASERRTHNTLKLWANTDKLVTPSFFFWNLGTPLQKSHTGMLRSFLCMVLKDYPELIPAVFPNLWQNWSDSEAEIQPSLVEVQRAFQLLISRSSRFLKHCLFIDGIDEFEGD